MMYVNSTSPAPLCISPDTQDTDTGCLKNFHPRLKYNSKSLYGNKNERYVETPADVACVL